MAPPQAFSLIVGRALGTAVVTVRGTLDLPGASQLASTLHDLIEGQGNLSVVVDLRQVADADVTVLGVLTAAADKAHRRGGTCTVSDPPALLYQAMQLRGLGRLVRTSEPDPFEHPARIHPSSRGLRPPDDGPAAFHDAV